LSIRRIAVKFVPRLLTDDQKQPRVNVCLELRVKANEEQAFFPWDHSGWQKLDLQLWSRNKATIVVEESAFPKIKKGASGP
jgi:hypothetical protein